ncbi:MAG: aminoacetone oxidase family FAD-binding enzyme [Oscillospiraceae bacterium]|nr:aminoacetone oxidase family FAD-binding enzyme [Oscillospiraceae bacterium]
MTVCVVGGGAAGMAAAITAAEQGRRVTLLERQSRVGRKLLSTGNGRCNLTNRAAVPGRHYHGADGAFCGPALTDFGVEDTLAWFRRLGLLTAEEPDGRFYPRSNMASSVLDVLRFALQQRSITVVTGCTVQELSVKEHHFTITADTGIYHADAVILAAGGAAGAKVGGTMDGYRLAQQLGHRRTELFPALVQLKTDPTYPRSLKGVKAEAALTLRRQDGYLAATAGEVLFTEYGVSGPAVFDLSRAMAGAERAELTLDLLPELTEEETLLWLTARQEAMAGQEAQSLLSGALHPRLGQVVCKACGFTAQAAQSLAEQDLRHIARTVHRFTLPVTGTCGFDQAQVTAGGLRTDDFDPATLQSRLVPGFYACGEVLDVDGDCGGFNLQWAWSSGRLAGRLL